MSEKKDVKEILALQKREKKLLRENKKLAQKVAYYESFIKETEEARERYEDGIAKCKHLEELARKAYQDAVITETLYRNVMNQEVAEFRKKSAELLKGAVEMQ